MPRLEPNPASGIVTVPRLLDALPDSIPSMVMMLPAAIPEVAVHDHVHALAGRDHGLDGTALGLGVLLAKQVHPGAGGVDHALGAQREALAGFRVFADQAGDLAATKHHQNDDDNEQKTHRANVVEHDTLHVSMRAAWHCIPSCNR